MNHMVNEINHLPFGENIILINIFNSDPCYRYGRCLVPGAYYINELNQIDVCMVAVI